MKTDAARKRSPGALLRMGATYALLLLLLVPFLFPLWWMISTGFKPLSQVFAFPPPLLPETWQWQNYLEAFRIRPLARHYLNSLYIATLVTLGVLVVSSLAGYAFARIRFRGSNLIFIVLLSALLVPSEVTIIPLFRLMSTLGWIDTHLPLIVLPILGTQSIFGAFLMRQFFLSLPGELEDAGRIDGLTRFGLFWYIALPLAKPALAALAILAFLNSWNDFLEPLIFLRDRTLFTLPLGLTTYTDALGQPLWNIQLAATSLSIIPVLVVFAFAQRYFIAGITGSGLKG